MKANAEWLKANPKVKVRIEGNCDERGTKEYNQALGQRRAASAKKYLTDMGISANRISIISYGKEKPVCSESTEGCWQKNRRDDFIAVYGIGSVSSCNGEGNLRRDIVGFPFSAFLVLRHWLLFIILSLYTEKTP